MVPLHSGLRASRLFGGVETTLNVMYTLGGGYYVNQYVRLGAGLNLTALAFGFGWACLA